MLRVPPSSSILTMYTIGLIGGVASGKSTVAEMLAELGAVVLNADRAAHDVLDQPEVRDQLVARWGRGVLMEDGRIERREVAALVFGGEPEVEEERQFLESIVHPLTRIALETQRELLAGRGQQVFVIDAPLLLEAGWDTSCDVIVLVDTPEEHRRKYAKKRGWSDEELDRREAAQMPLDEKRHRADLVIDNAGDLAATRRQVHHFWNELVVPRLGE
jgi:dephospho-CoA kinase